MLKKASNLLPVTQLESAAAPGRRYQVGGIPSYPGERLELPLKGKGELLHHFK